MAIHGAKAAKELVPMIPLCPVEIFFFAALVLSALLISRFLEGVEEGIVPSVLIQTAAQKPTVSTVGGSTAFTSFYA